MSVTSVEFLITLLALGGIYFFLPAGRARRAFLAVANVAVLSWSVKNCASWVVLALFLLSGYGSAVAIGRLPERDSKNRAMAVYIGLLLIGFIVLKEYRFIGFLVPTGSVSRYVVIVGLSYMLFRQIHFVVDAVEGQIEHPSLWTYLNYQLNLFTLTAGPIQRYQEFAPQWDSTAPVLRTSHQQRKAYARMLLGILKVGLVGKWLLMFADRCADQPLSIRSPRQVLRFAGLLYAYPGYIYFNFSGYCDVVIAGASLVGMKVPENFNRPYLARNMIDFWTRWHMTLTHWIRDYVFNPLYKNGIEHAILSPQRLSYVCYFIALFLAGVWHGSSWNFVVFGLLHGGGVSATKMWEDRIIRRIGRPGLRQYLQSRPIRIVAMLVTFHFVCVTFLFFPTDLRGRLRFLEHFLRGGPTAASVVAS